MKRLHQRIIITGAVLAGALFLGRDIVVSAASDSPVIARASDAKAALREEVPVNGADFRAEHPEGFVVSAPGIVEPADRPIEVAADALGRVVELAVEEGARVEAGTVMLRLDGAVEAAMLAAAEAEALAARADAKRAEDGSFARDIDAARAALVRTEAQAALSSGVAERTRRLADAKSVSTDELDRALRVSEADAAAVAVARAQLSAAESRRDEARLTARARIAAAEAKIREARARLMQKEVRAPISGEVLQVRLRAGEYYDPAKGPMIVMGDTRRLRARIDVDERDLAKVAVGQPAIIRVSAHPGRDFSGTVVELGRRMGRKNVRTDDPAERNDTKILEVVVELDPAKELLVGQRVDAFLKEST